MSEYLLDANVISMIARSTIAVSGEFLVELTDGDGQALLPVFAIHKAEKHIALFERKRSAVKAVSLRQWLTRFVAAYDNKISHFDRSDAGLAKARHLIVATRNAKHFAPCEVSVLCCPLTKSLMMK